MTERPSNFSEQSRARAHVNQERKTMAARARDQRERQSDSDTERIEDETWPQGRCEWCEARPRGEGLAVGLAGRDTLRVCQSCFDNAARVTPTPVLCDDPDEMIEEGG